MGIPTQLLAYQVYCCATVLRAAALMLKCCAAGVDWSVRTAACTAFALLWSVSRWVGSGWWVLGGWRLACSPMCRGVVKKRTSPQRNAPLLLCLCFVCKGASPLQELSHTNFTLMQSTQISILKSRFTAVRSAAQLYCCCSSGLTGGCWVGGGCATWVNCCVLCGIGSPLQELPLTNSKTIPVYCRTYCHTSVLPWWIGRWLVGGWWVHRVVPGGLVSRFVCGWIVSCCGGYVSPTSTFPH